MGSMMHIRKAEFIKGLRGTDPILYDGVPQVAFIGRSNVGKSSMINALLKSDDIVKTGKKPGKTTEINFFALNGREAYVVDLPGYGYARVHPDEKEKIRKLILWYIQFSEVKPLCLVIILDVKAGVTAFDHDILTIIKECGHRVIVVANKVDKLNQKERAAALSGMQAELQKGKYNAELILGSAETREGVEELLQKIFK